MWPPDPQIRFFVDHTGTYHLTPECPEYGVARDAWWAFPYYRKPI